MIKYLLISKIIKYTFKVSIKLPHRYLINTKK